MSNAYNALVQGRAGLVSRWKLGESAGTTAADAKSANDATLHGGVTLGQAGAIVGDTDTAFAFNGSTGYLSVPAAVALELTAAFTVKAWVDRGASGDGWIFEKTIGGSVNTSYLLFVEGTVVKGRIVTAGGMVTVQDTNGCPSGSYGYFAMVYDGTNIRLVRNGVTVAGPTAAGHALAGTGIAYIGGGDAYYHAGKLDDVQVLNVAQTDAELLAEYNLALDPGNATVTVPSAAAETVSAPAAAVAISAAVNFTAYSLPLLVPTPVFGRVDLASFPATVVPGPLDVTILPPRAALNWLSPIPTVATGLVILPPQATVALLAAPADVSGQVVVEGQSVYSRRSLLALRRLLAGALGGYALVLTSDLALGGGAIIADALAGGLDANAYLGAWLLPTKSGAFPGSAAGVIRRVGNSGLNTTTGELTVSVPWGVDIPPGVAVEIHTFLPPVAREKTTGLRECLNRALAELWAPQRLIVTGVAGQPSYDLSTYDWLDPEAVRELYHPAWSTSLLPFPVPSWDAYASAGSVTLDVMPTLATGDLAQLDINRPLDSWIKHNGTWATSLTGLVEDADECLANPQLLVTVALVYAYEAMSALGDKSAEWDAKANRQRLRANVMKLQMLNHQQRRLSRAVGSYAGSEPKDWASW